MIEFKLETIKSIFLNIDSLYAIFQSVYMNSNLEDILVNTQRAYIKARLKAEKSRDSKSKEKIKQAKKSLENVENFLEKTENEADKTMDPKLKKKSDDLFRKLQTI